MNREEHRDAIRKAQMDLNQAMQNAAIKAYIVVIDTVDYSMTTGGSYPIFTASTLEPV